MRGQRRSSGPHSTGASTGRPGSYESLMNCPRDWKQPQMEKLTKIDERMGIVRTALDKAEASVAENEDHLEESQIREEEAHQGDQGQSNSSEGQDDDVVVEGPEESGPTGAESTSPLRSQEAEPSMEVDMDDILQLTSGGTITVTNEVKRCSWVIPPQWLERWPSYRSPLLTAISLRMVKTHNRSCPPQCVSEVLHMSLPHRLKRRRKKEDFNVRFGKEVMNQMQRQNQAVFMYCY